MAKTQLKASDSQGFMRAAWDQQKDTEASFQCVIGISVLQTPRKGVYLYRLTAVRGVESAQSLQTASYGFEYPNASSDSLEAAFYRAFFQLDHLLTVNEKWPSGRG